MKIECQYFPSNLSVKRENIFFEIYLSNSKLSNEYFKYFYAYPTEMSKNKMRIF